MDMSVKRQVRIGWGLLLAAFFSCAVPRIAGAQTGNRPDSETEPGYERIVKTCRIVDKDGRPWVEPRTVGVRLDQASAPQLNLPDPLHVDATVEYPTEDPQFQNRFSSQYGRNGAQVTLVLCAPLDDPSMQIPYELVFFRGARKYSEVKHFGASVSGVTGLQSKLVVPARVPPQWNYIVPAVILWLGLITFGLYRPVYRAMLDRDTRVDVAKDWAFFLWWFFMAVGYAVLLYLWIPRSMPFLVVLGVLVLVALIRLVASLRPRPAQVVAD